VNREDFYVGQTLFCLDHGSGGKRRTEVKVTKVGRVNVTVEVWGREYAYRMDTGYAVRDFGGRVVTPEVLLREEAARAVKTSLREHGLTVGPPGNRYPMETWAEVLAILDKAKADG
jgi:hypothetical protein